MKAFLLAAGEGTRLYPLTRHTPKCLVPIGGKPLLEIWFKILENHGIREVLINTHHLADRVENFLKSLHTSIKVTTVYEPELLGSAGTLRRNKVFVGDVPYFFIIYADSFTTVNLTNLLNFHRKNAAHLTMGLFHTAEPKRSGIVTIDESGRIIDFIEKPENPPGDLSNTGIMVASPKVLEEIPEHYPCDLSLHVLPNLIGRMYGLEINEYFIDIGTTESYKEANGQFENISFNLFSN